MHQEDGSRSQTPTFRIRFTISSNSNSNSRDPDGDESNLDPSIDNSSDQLTNKHETIDQVDELSGRLSSADIHTKKKAFKFLQPQNHKSSLFVNLTDLNKGEADGSRSGPGTLSIISPDLEQESSPPTPSESSEPTLFNPFTQESSELETNDTKLLNCHGTSSTCEPIDSSISEIYDRGEMSQSCNFFSSMMNASRRRSSPAKAKPVEVVESLRRTSQPGQDLMPLANSPRPTDDLATNDTIKPLSLSRQQGWGSDPEYSDFDMMQPLRIEVDSQASESDLHDQETPYIHMDTLCSNSRDNIGNILQLEEDNSQLEEECKDLAEQVQFMRNKVDDLERKRFSEQVSRSLVDRVLKQRKEIRELDLQIYKLNLESSDHRLNNQPGRKTMCRSNVNIQTDNEDSYKDPHDTLHDQVDEDYISPKNEIGGGFMMDDESNNEEDNDNDDDDDEEGEDDDDDYDDDDYKQLEDMPTGLSECIISNQQLQQQQQLATGKYGSHIEPGQENTAYILDAIPPSCDLQRKEYLSKASSGTDSSSSSQVASFDHRKLNHKHSVPSASHRHHQYSSALAQHQYLNHNHQQQRQQQPQQQKHHQQQAAINQDGDSGSSQSHRGANVDMIREQAHPHLYQKHHNHHNHKQQEVSHDLPYSRRQRPQQQLYRNDHQQQHHHQGGVKQKHQYVMQHDDEFYVPLDLIKVVGGTDNCLRGSSRRTGGGRAATPNGRSASPLQESRRSPVRPRNLDCKFRPNHSFMDSSSTSSSASPHEPFKVRLYELSISGGGLDKTKSMAAARSDHSEQVQ